KNRQRKVLVDFHDRDIFSIAHEEEIGVAVIVRVRGGRFFSREKIYLRQIRTPEEALESVITRFYMDSFDIPKELALPFAVPNEDAIYLWLSEKREGALKIKYPQRGEKARELRVAHQNAKLLLGEWILAKKKRKEYIPNSLKQLQDDLQLKAPPRTIEAFDISHLGGTNTVASMVYFKDGKPVKKKYRKYNIKTITGIDDYSSIREVVIRRYKRLLKEKSPLPDLILIDGGKGQLSMAVSALRQLGITYVPVIGLAKRLEEVFLPGQSEPQSISKSSPGLLLLRRVRDEAHRFAVSFQRQKRSKSISESLFLNINGMGPKRVNNLFTHYQDIEDIAMTKPEVISKRLSISKELSVQCIALANGMIKKKKS
ncbi:MAG: excinuclease ABC subunit C, partial [SAR324 cluster bacterium]|nr:excinuclease ABC subunit C [SAR324 cluster bacterium]